MKADLASQVGVIEDLTEIPINETLQSANSSTLVVPPLWLEFGLYKAVYRLEVNYN